MEAKQTDGGVSHVLFEPRCLHGERNWDKYLQQ